jgi:hypothetical protein
MTPDAPTEQTQCKMLRLLIAEAQTSGPRYAKELATFAEAFSERCGHNRLEQIGIRWSTVLTADQKRVLVTERDAAISFATILHSSLMRYLLPSDTEIDTLEKSSLLKWNTALRMGIQGVLRRRAELSDGSVKTGGLPMLEESFLQSMQPVIRQAAAEFFPDVKPDRKTGRSS